MSDFGQKEFEACLLDLGEVPKGPFDEVIEVADSAGWVVPTDIAASLGGVVLFGTRRFTGDDSPMTVQERLESLTQQLGFELTEDGLDVNAAATTVYCPNRYCLTAYFPKGDKGRGEAAYYEMPYFGKDFEGASKTITVEEATELVAMNSVPIGDSGLFVPRFIAESDRLAQAPLQRKESVEQYVAIKQPAVTLKVDVTDSAGNFEFLEPEQTYYDSANRFLNKFNYHGSAQAAFAPSSLTTFRVMDGRLQKLTGIRVNGITFSNEHPLLLDFGLTRSPVNSREELANTWIHDSGHLASRNAKSLRREITMEEALEMGALQLDDCDFEPADPLDLLFQVLASDNYTNHVRSLREKVRPKIDVDSFLAGMHSDARAQWHGVLFEGETLEPKAVGFGAVARLAGLTQTDRDQLIAAAIDNES